MDARKHGKKSSSLFLAFSITVLVLPFVSFIAALIFVSILYYRGENNTAAGSSSAQIATNNVRVVAKDIQPAATSTSNSEERLPKKPAIISAAGRDFIDRFKQHNKYICDKNKMQRYADKMFDDLDTDKGGVLVSSEIVDFLTNFLRIKRTISLPSDRKTAVLIRKYDVDKSGIYERYEFKQILFEIFLESSFLSS